MTAGSEKTREKAKRTKRDNRKKHDSKRQDTGDGGYERKTTVSSSSSAIPSLELPMLMPIPVADPRPFDVLHPKPRQMNLSSTKYSEVLGQSYKFYEIADKYVFTHFYEDGCFECITNEMMATESATEMDSGTHMQLKTQDSHTLNTGRPTSRRTTQDSALKIPQLQSSSQKTAEE